ncbi:HNH endonuclease [Polyangium jinanense]|uniref:HNH endonuclease n=1 Tax=Polyangium jinanense TaxID=2829994 RepID=A0A9X4AVX5_9BACT|nr:HNH endonuclease [Polyangium jinanense]MDC3984802.1 HNH endonuclease [Polyangium jinanense]
MTSHRALSPSSNARLWGNGAALMLVGAAVRFLRLAFPLLFAVCVSVWLVGCGAAGVRAEGWAQELQGKSLFRVCRRHPRVGPHARYWYELGDGVHRPAFEPLEKLLENPSVKAVFIHDPHAPPESRRLLGLAYQDLPCDKPPPPPPPPEKIAAEEPEAGPAKGTTVRTVTRTSAMRPCDRPGNRPPDQRFLGQTAPTPAPMPGTRVPCPPPPPGKTYEEQKVNLARRDAEEEARRTGERIGREWGATLGKAAGVKDSIDVTYLGNFDYDIRDKPDAEVFEVIRTNLAKQLDAIPDLPTYDDERLATIAWEGFLKGYGRGWADAELKFAIVNALADTLLMVASGGAAALETVGARVLRGAQQRLRSMPVFLPSAAGGPGGFLRRPKLPSPPAASTPKAVAPPSATTVTTTTKPVRAPNGAAGQAGAPKIRNQHLAGKNHPKTGVPFDAEGYPDFKAAGVVKREVKITQTGDRPHDYRLANEAAGEKVTPKDHTWHHHQDGKTMQLVPTQIHADTGHTGGVATKGRP